MLQIGDVVCCHGYHGTGTDEHRYLVDRVLHAVFAAVVHRACGHVVPLALGQPYGAFGKTCYRVGRPGYGCDDHIVAEHVLLLI